MEVPYGMDDHDGLEEFLTFRFDYEEHKEKVPEILKFIEHNCKKYIIFDEVAKLTGKLHLQGKVQCKKSPGQFRKDLKARFVFLDPKLNCSVSIFHKANYSFAPITNSKHYDLYIAKDGNVRINNIWSQDKIDKLKSQYLPEEEWIKKQKEKNKTLTWSQRIAQEMKEKIPDVIDKYIELNQFETLSGEAFACDQFNDYKACKLLLLEFILERLGDAVKSLSSGVLNSLFYGIINSFMMKSSAKKEWVKKIAKKLDNF